jgi:hypothetical protein
MSNPDFVCSRGTPTTKQIRREVELIRLAKLEAEMRQCNAETKELKRARREAASAIKTIAS